jgi:hypothetical protein
MNSLESLQRSFYSRQRNFANQQSQTFNQTGKTSITIPSGSQAAEATFDVSFWNTYTEQPCFTSGMALDSSSSLVVGQFPTCTATVYNWDTLAPPNILPGADPSLFSYVGASLAVVVSGSSNQVIWVHYSFVGQGLSIPAPAMPTNGTGNA